jgi:outer membrane lipoprotein-sorting protein
MLVYRSHFVRTGTRDPKARAKVESGMGDNPIIPKDKKLDWEALAERDRTISAALREALARQTPLREPRPAEDVRAEAEGKKLFEALEQKLAGAKGYRVEYESEVLTSMSHGRVKGTLALAPGNRMKLVNEFAPADPLLHEPDGKMTFVSDGKTLVLYNTATGKPGKTEPVMDRVQETLTGWLIRIGDFKRAGKEKVNGREANIITFTLTKGMVGKTSHKLWLDAETGLPLKQVVETQDRFGVVETYHNWELSPALPEETFALPK